MAPRKAPPDRPAPSGARRLAVIYVRISSDREGGGLGVARQAEDCRALAAALGITIIAVLDDNDMSAYSGKPRPGYRRLLAMIAAGDVTDVLCWHADRLHRRPAELEEYITLCEDNGVITRTVKAGELDLATPSGRMAARMFGAAARYQVEHMIAQIERSHVQRAQAGKWAGGSRPFGYDDGGMVIREDEAAAIRQAAAMILDGASLKEIARQWKAAGITGARGGTWSGHDVGALLRLPRIAGLRARYGQVIAPAEWPAILDEATWRAVSAILSDPARLTNTAGPEYAWLGAGLFRCGIPGCGGIVTTGNGGGQSHRERVYRCPEGRPGARHVSRVARLIDAHVMEVLALRIEALGPHPETPAPAQSGPGAHASIAAAQARMRDAARKYGLDQITEEQLDEITAGARERIAAAEAQIAVSSAPSPLRALDGAPDVRKALAELPLSQVRAILSAMAVVTIGPAPRGRPAGWRVGQPYFDAESVVVKWR